MTHGHVLADSIMTHTVKSSRCFWILGYFLFIMVAVLQEKSREERPHLTTLETVILSARPPPDINQILDTPKPTV